VWLSSHGLRVMLSLRLLHRLAHDLCNKLLLVLLDTWVPIFVSKVYTLSFHADTLAVIVKLFVAKHSRNAQLVWIPELKENFFYVVLMHAKSGQVELGAGFTDEGAVGDVCVRGLSLVAINAVSIELVVCHNMNELFT